MFYPAPFTFLNVGVETAAAFRTHLPTRCIALRILFGVGLNGKKTSCGCKSCALEVVSEYDIGANEADWLQRSSF